MLGLGITRAEAEIVGVLIILAAALMWLGFHDAAIKNAATAPVLAEIHAAAEAASAAEAIKAVKTDAEQAANLHEANAQNAARAVDSRALAAVVRGLHDDAVRPGAAAQSASASSGGSGISLSAPDVVPGVLYRATAAALADTASDAQDLAEYADCLRTSGQLCELDYHALTP